MVQGLSPSELKKNFVNSFPNKPWFLHVYSTNLSKTPWENEKLLVTSNFSLYHSVFYPFGDLIAIFIQFKIVVCWESLKFVILGRIKLTVSVKTLIGILSHIQ